MSKWPIVRLGDYIEQIRGVSYKPENLGNKENTLCIPLLRANNIQDDGLLFEDLVYVDKKRVHNKQVIKKGDIIICTSSGSKNLVGKAAQASCDLAMTFGAFCKLIRAKDIEKRYLAHYFSSPKYRHTIAALSGGVNINNLRNEHIDDLTIYLPPLETQKKIADVLDKAKSLIDLRKKQIEKMDLLIKSNFIEMFGDPVTNPKGWRVTLFTEVATIDTHMTTDWEKYNDLPHVGIENIEKDTGHITKLKLVRDSELISGKYIFDKRHIIYSKIRPNLNKVALPDFTGVCSADAYPILPKSNTTRYYLAYILRNQLFLDYILSYSDRTNIPKVNKKQLSGFQLPLPPIEDQNYFTVFVKSVEKQKNQLQQALDKMEMNYKSMMQEYFR